MLLLIAVVSQHVNLIIKMYLNKETVGINEEEDAKYATNPV